jgi:hypothetical protein
MTKWGFIISIILLIAKLFAGATLGWFTVALPMLVGVVVDCLIVLGVLWLTYKAS